MKFFLILVSTAVVFFPQAKAQKAPAPAPVASPGRTTTPGLPTTNPPNTFPQPSTTNNDTGSLTQRPIYISGKVLMEDGTPPPDFVRVEKICGGNPRPEGYTDSKGRFSFQLDSGMDVMADASDASFGRPGTQPGLTGMSSSNRERNLSGCDIRAALAGFRSDSVSLAFHGSMDNPNVGTIFLHRMGNVEGSTISMTSLNAPKDAQKAFQKGRDAMKKEKTEEAAKDFQRAVDEYPKYAAAWFELGRVQVAQNQNELAVKSFRQAIEADGKFVSPYIELSALSVKNKDWPKAVELTDRAIKLNPADFPEVYFYNSVANLNLQNLDAAKKSALEAQKLDSRHRIGQIQRLLDTINASQKPSAER